MRHVELFGTDIRTTALGFGTSSLMGKLDRAESLRLLEVAYDSGIRHFDTAPLYGYGESEALLGAFRRTHSDITVTTKFGLSRRQGLSFLLNRGKQIVRPVLRAFPSVNAAALSVVNTRAPIISAFTTRAAAASLRHSLKLLGRGYVDLLLLHECRPATLHDDELLQFLTKAREKGQIRAFGLATDIETITSSIGTAREYVAVVQFANNSAEPGLERNPTLASEHACITHSPFGGTGLSSIGLASSALSYAKAHNPGGIVLFSSQRPQHIVDNVLEFESV